MLNRLPNELKLLILKSASSVSLDSVFSLASITRDFRSLYTANERRLLAALLNDNAPVAAPYIVALVGGRMKQGDVDSATFLQLRRSYKLLRLIDNIAEEVQSDLYGLLLQRSDEGEQGTTQPAPDDSTSDSPYTAMLYNYGNLLAPGLCFPTPTHFSKTELVRTIIAIHVFERKIQGWEPHERQWINLSMNPKWSKSKLLSRSLMVSKALGDFTEAERKRIAGIFYGTDSEEGGLRQVEYAGDILWRFMYPLRSVTRKWALIQEAGGNCAGGIQWMDTLHMKVLELGWLHGALEPECSEEEYLEALIEFFTGEWYPNTFFITEAMRDKVEKEIARRGLVMRF